MGFRKSRAPSLVSRERGRLFAFSHDGVKQVVLLRLILTLGLVFNGWLSGALATAFLTPQGGQPDAGQWKIHCADCPKMFEEMGDRSLRLDAAGRGHIAYGGDHLYYAWHDGATWQFETADGAPGVGQYASLALDSAGRPHIAYYDSVARDLRYARRDAGGWTVQVVARTAMSACTPRWRWRRGAAPHRLLR